MKNQFILKYYYPDNIHSTITTTATIMCIVLHTLLAWVVTGVLFWGCCSGLGWHFFWLNIRGFISYYSPLSDWQNFKKDAEEKYNTNNMYIINIFFGRRQSLLCSFFPVLWINTPIYSIYGFNSDNLDSKWYDIKCNWAFFCESWYLSTALCSFSPFAVLRVSSDGEKYWR